MVFQLYNSWHLPTAVWAPRPDYTKFFVMSETEIDSGGQVSS